MGTFEIYVLGDVAAFHSTLNALAMFFNLSGFIAAAAALGGLVALLGFIFYLFNLSSGGGAATLPGAVSFPSIIVFFIFYSGLTIKADVQIHDVFTDQITFVDNVPAMVAIPASVISKTTYRVFERTNTAFQSASGSYMALGQTGFIAPLQVLLSMRDGLGDTNPYFLRSFQTFMYDCLPGSPALDMGKMVMSADAFEEMMLQARDTGITTYYSVNLPQGQIQFCNEMKASLRVALNDFTDDKGGNLTKLLNLKTSSKNPGGAAISPDMAQEAVERVVLSSTAGIGQSSMQYMKNALLYKAASNAFKCMGSRANPTELNACDVMTTQAYEQWVVDSAGAGTMFTKTMFPTMVFMQLLFYGLCPVVLIFALIKGPAGIPLYIKFLGFGVWTSSWLPVASIIQMYIQNNVQEKLQQLLTVQGVTWSNFKTVYYDVLSANLAIASDMLAATPLVTATVLGISGMAMASLAGRAGGKDYVDEKQMAPSVLENKAFMSAGSGLSTNTQTGITTQAGVAAPEISFQSTNKEAFAEGQKNLKSATSTADSIFTRSISQANQDIASRAFQSMSQSSAMTSAGATFSNDGSIAFTDGKTRTLSAQEVQSGVATVGGKLSAGLSGAQLDDLSGENGDKAMQRAQANFGADLSAGLSAQFGWGSNLTAARSAALSEITRTTLGSMFGSSASRQNTNSDTALDSSSSSYVDQIAGARSIREQTVDSAQKEWARTREMAVNSGTSVSMIPEEALAKLRKDATEVRRVQDFSDQQGASGNIAWEKSVEHYRQLYSSALPEASTTELGQVARLAAASHYGYRLGNDLSLTAEQEAKINHAPNVDGANRARSEIEESQRRLDGIPGTPEVPSGGRPGPVRDPGLPTMFTDKKIDLVTNPTYVKAIEAGPEGEAAFDAKQDSEFDAKKQLNDELDEKWKGRN